MNPLPATPNAPIPFFFDGVDLEALARKIPTPFHAYSANAIRQRIAELKSALAGTDSLICFAVKANSNLAILQLMAQAGVGADIVSSGELWRCLRAQIPASRIVFSGVGKREDEIDEALAAGILRFNVESRDELETLQRIAHARGAVAKAAVRVNPDVDAGTLAKITTGKSENKFGVSLDEARTWFAARASWPNVQLDGLHVHIGSQILALEPYRKAFEQVAAFARELGTTGHAIDSIDVGGGLGVAYREGDTPIPAAAYIQAVRRVFADFGGRLIFEPGRFLVADAGVLLTRVIRIKRGSGRDFLIVDAAMNDLVRPSLYEAWHAIEPVTKTPRPTARYDVVGPVCESSDTFGRARELPRCEPGDLLMIRTTGAYGSSMESTFNSRPHATEVLLDNARYAIVRRRQTFEELVAGESAAADWQTP
ncbi:MAG TPA: diaminopimelate decarboxylase [Rudaea sp.]